MSREVISNNDKAALYVTKMKRFVDKVIAGEIHVPIQHGRVNASMVAKQLGFARERFHSNALLEAELTRLRQFMGENASTASRTGEVDKEVRVLEARIKTLEKSLLLKTIELETLREEYRRREHAEDHLLRTGRIIHPFHRPCDSNAQFAQG